MKTRLVMSWDDNDPFPMGKRVEEAFNRVTEFCPELRSPEKNPVQTSYNRVVGGEFEDSDLHTLLKYALEISRRVNAKYDGSSPIGQSIIQALENLYTVVKETAEYVTKNFR